MRNGMRNGMRVKFQTTLNVNLKEILKGCIINVSDNELNSDIKGIVLLWAEQRLREDGWPVPNTAKHIREYLLENNTISEKPDD
jgi:hypothetical protein